jgi:L-alanine-DL-glutamate epimerase-like enolase superfamily enzyme
MKITAVETYWTRTPFDMGGKPAAVGGLGWQSMNTVWLRISTDQGLEGWGEGFGHASAAATKTVMDGQLAPALIGQDARDIAGLRARLAKAFHGFGRNGAHVFALSALDIALWDIAGKAAGLPLWRLLGATPVAQLTSYASLLRYGEASQVAAACERAIARGYRDIKLHEITVPEVRAARQAIGPDARLMVDTNCPWTVWQRSTWPAACASST